MGSGDTLAGATQVNLGEWHHVAAVYGSGILRLYVDGKLEDKQMQAGEMKRNDFEVLIGENAERQGRCLNGLVDDVLRRIPVYPEAHRRSRLQSNRVCPGDQDRERGTGGTTTSRIPARGGFW